MKKLFPFGLTLVLGTCFTDFFIEHNETDMTIEAIEAAQVLLTLVGFQRRRGIWSLKSPRKDAVVSLGRGVSRGLVGNLN